MAYYNRGVVYCKKENFKKGLKDFSRAIELDPDFSRAYYNRGVAYKLLKQYKKAATDFNKALELNPNYKKVLKEKQWRYYAGKTLDTR